MRALGWAMFAATVALFAAQAALLSMSDDALLSYRVLVDQAFPLVGIGAVIGAGVGALIVNRYPRNIIGWLFLIGQLGNVVSLASESFYTVVAQGIIDAPVSGQVSGYLSELFDATYTVAILAVIFMIAPDGRLLSPRWRIAVAVPVAAVATRVAVVLSQPASDFVPGAVVQYGSLSLTLLFTSFFLLLVSILLGAIALGLRMRRSTAEQRLQLRWIATAAFVLAAAFITLGIADIWLDPVPWVLTEAVFLAYIFVAIAVGIAILKYRLYDIDVILNRAIVLGVLAVFVTVGYVAVVVAIGAVLVAIGSSGSTLHWPSLLAAALVAVAFQPLRRHVLRLADDLVYGNRAAPYEALADLSRRLADSPSPSELPGRVAEASGRAVGAARVIVTLGKPGHAAPVRQATWPPMDDAAAPPAAMTPAALLPVVDMEEQVGNIEVLMPAGRGLRTFERNLLEDVAAQAGMAFRNALLEAELAARVADGEAASAELAASRRRLVGVEDEARVSLAAAIRRRVVPHLAVVQQELAASDAVGTLPDPQALGEVARRLIGSTERALEELRIVCRGVFPALLERRGLVPALETQLHLTHPLAQLRADESAAGRLDRAAEAAGYVFCTEVAPPDRPSVITLSVDDDALVARVAADNNSGEDAAGAGPGDAVDEPETWQHARDRVAALDGVVRVDRDGDRALTVTARIPLGGQPALEPVMSAHSSSSRSGPNDALGT